MLAEQLAEGKEIQGKVAQVRRLCMEQGGWHGERAQGAVLQGCEEQLETKVAEESLDLSERKMKKKS